MPDVITPLPDLVLYARPGCGLCDEARAIIGAVLADRDANGLPAPALREVDITTDPALERRWFDRIPVVELGERRVELVTGVAKVRRLLADALD